MTGVFISLKLGDFYIRSQKVEIHSIHEKNKFNQFWNMRKFMNNERAETNSIMEYAIISPAVRWCLSNNLYHVFTQRIDILIKNAVHWIFNKSITLCASHYFISCIFGYFKNILSGIAPPNVPNSVPDSTPYDFTVHLVLALIVYLIVHLTLHIVLALMAYLIVPLTVHLVLGLIVSLILHPWKVHQGKDQRTADLRFPGQAVCTEDQNLFNFFPEPFRAKVRAETLRTGVEVV